MRYARWAAVLACLGLAGACTASDGQTRPPAEQKQVQESSAFTDLVAPGERHTTVGIVLTEQNGRCVKTDPVEPIYTKKGRRVTWFIQNGCSKPLDLRFTGFDMKPPSGTTFDPFATPPPNCHADPGGSCLTVPSKRPPFAVIAQTGPHAAKGVWVFTYQIVDGDGHVIDPEIVIEWF
jgi:hypothetical protein